MLGTYAAIPFSSFDLAFSAGVAGLLLFCAVAARVIIGRIGTPARPWPVRVPAPAQADAEAETVEREAVAAG